MDRPDLTPNKRRRLQELQGSLDRIRQADANYFRRFPYRQHRVRVAADVEIEEAKLLGTEQHYIAVWKLTPDGDCWRLLMTGPPAVSYTHLPSPRDRTRSRMPSSA